MPTTFLEFFEIIKNLLNLNQNNLKKLFCFLLLYIPISFYFNAIMENMNIFQKLCVIALCWCISYFIIDFYNKVKKNIERKQRKKIKETIQNEEELKLIKNIETTLDNLPYGEKILLKYIFYAPSSVIHLPVDNPVALGLFQKKIISLTNLCTSSIRGEYPYSTECLPFYINDKFLEYMNANRKKFDKEWEDLPIADKIDTYQKKFY